MHRVASAFVLLALPAFVSAAPFSNSLTGFAGKTSQDESPSQPSFATTNGFDFGFLWTGGKQGAWEQVNFSTSGATFGSNQGGDRGRNYLRTTESDYNQTSFDAYVTYINSTTGRAFMGVGGGDRGWDSYWGLPDGLTGGNDTAFVEILNGSFATNYKKGTDDHVSNASSATPTLSGNPTRIKMHFDTVAGTVQFAIDNNYNGSTFNPTTTLSPLSLSSAGLLGSSSLGRVFIGGDANATLKDFAVVVPEPASLGLVMVSALGVAGLRRRHRVA